MPLPVRYFLVLIVAGAGLALGIGLLIPEVHTIMNAGRAGGEENLVELTELSQRTEVFDREGKLVAVLKAEENRQPVELSQVPVHVQNAILDVEDDRFWHHGGVDLRSTVRALRTNIDAGGVRQGGSTITQQLVKNALLTPERSMNRKVREAVLALRLEDKLSKEEILERYLNIVYFGNGAYGVQAAAETYFNSKAEDLTLPQAALLAGIIRNPEGYDPIKNPEAAEARREIAIGRMMANNHITEADAERIRQEPIPTRLSQPLPAPDDYFVEEVKQRLLDDERLGETAQERYNAVFKGGLRIFTTLDSRMQRAAEEQVRRIVPDTKGKFTAALVSVEPETGYVRAMVAGKDFKEARYNLATARGGSGRQPGSSFKPFVLLAALEKGHSINDTIDGQTPCSLKIPGFFPNPYEVENYEGSSGGTMTITDATVHSVNCAYVRLGLAAGLGNVVDVAGRLGIPKSRLQPVPSMSLGTLEVSPLDMASAYAAIANDGVRHAPRFVERIEDRTGKFLFGGPDKGERAVEVQHARQAVKVMRQVVQKGTGTRARLPGRQVMGKTGTSQEHQNAWFVGATPQLATAVWMGSPAGNIEMRNVGGIRVTGGSYPARIFGAFMDIALEGMESEDFTEPDPKRIEKGTFIKDNYGTVKRKPTTTTTTAVTVPGDPAPVDPGPAPTSTTSTPPTTAKPPTTTTTTSPTQKPDGGGQP